MRAARPLRATGEIDGLVVDDGEQVRGEATARTIKGEERFLDRVFGRRSFTQDAIRQPEGATADAIVERAHGRRIAPLDSVEQRIGIDELCQRAASVAAAPLRGIRRACGRIRGATAEA